MSSHYDVVIVGGGPAGSTVGTLLKKYAPDLSVLILEKEKFPRDHVGESQLPGISDILAEMGCWDKVEAANFPIKIGATYRWGKDPSLWDFDFIPVSEFKDEPRPAKYQGQRQITAFQVDRAIYDDILLRHSEEIGCEVKEETAVAKVNLEGDRISDLLLSNGQRVTARHYVDCSGHTGVLRRALNVHTNSPTRLQNIAIWDYWENAEWAEEIGVGGTRVQVMSLGHGWIWFIPLGPTRTSIGFICPIEHYKKLKKKPEDVYTDALQSEPRIANLISNANRRGKIETTKDWSFLAERLVGQNWFLAGEAAGFADPILAAGMTLTHSGAREAAYTILELERGNHDATWLKANYEQTQQRRITQHIRFADYWYAANGQFTDLKKTCRDIAKDSGLKLTPDDAFRWLAQGGFTNDHVDQAVIGGFDPGSMKHVVQKFSAQKATWQIDGFNIFKLNLVGAREEYIPKYSNGKITRLKCYVRDNHRLPITGYFDLLFNILSATSDLTQIANAAKRACQRRFSSSQHARIALNQFFQCLDVLVSEGWVRTKLDKKRPTLNMVMQDESAYIHSHQG